MTMDSDAQDPGVRRIVVGVDGSMESVAALRWACREASLRAAEVLAVLAMESACHQVASYSVPVPRSAGGGWVAARDVRRRKLLFRAWRRGVREMDLIVGRFADAHIEAFDAAGLDDFERLIEAPNADLYAWVIGTENVPASYDTAVLAELKAFHMQTKTTRAGEGA